MGRVPPRGGWSIREHGLAAHLRDAIRLNRARRAVHTHLGGARAFLLSSVLIGVERALLPMARLLDRQAAPFVEADVPILVADIAPMRGDGTAVSAVPSPLDKPCGEGLQRVHPVLSGPEDAVVKEDVGDRRFTRDVMREVRCCLRIARRAAKGSCFPEAAGAIHDALRDVRAAEAGEDRVYALAAHVLESAGLMALRAPGYAAATGGGTLPLSRRLVAGHLALVPMAVRLDRAAHPVHVRGAGLFVDDLPPIPFEAEYDRAHA